MFQLCRRDEIDEGCAKGIEVNGQKLIVANYRGQIQVFQNSCPHRSIPLEWMPDQFFDADKNFLQCATHGALFKPDTGECVFGPCVGDRLTVVNFIERDGALWLDNEAQ